MMIRWSRRTRSLSLQDVKASNGDAWVRGRRQDLLASQISAFILQKMKRDRRGPSRQKVDQAVITVRLFQRRASVRAQQDAGKMPALKCWRIHQRADAASTCYGLDKTKAAPLRCTTRRGTFDISILEIGDGVSR